MVKYKKVKEETPDQLRAKFPKELVDAFLKVSNAGWTEDTYVEYRKHADTYLGDKADPIDAGRLVVNLSSATSDLRQKEKPNVEKVKKLKEKNT